MFLDHLAEAFNRSVAAKRAGVSRSAVHWLRVSSPAFRSGRQNAIAADHGDLELRMLNTARRGAQNRSGALMPALAMRPNTMTLGGSGLVRCWPFWARPRQIAPLGPWWIWLTMAGRGFGKTRAGAEWARANGEAKPDPLWSEPVRAKRAK